MPEDKELVGFVSMSEDGLRADRLPPLLDSKGKVCGVRGRRYKGGWKYKISRPIVYSEEEIEGFVEKRKWILAQMRREEDGMIGEAIKQKSLRGGGVGLDMTLDMLRIRVRELEKRVEGDESR